MIESIILNDLPIHGMSHQGKYYFRLRKAKGQEKQLYGTLEGLTLDIVMLTVPDQARIIIASPMARTNTIEMGDAVLIKKETWESVVSKIYNKLITTD